MTHFGYVPASSSPAARRIEQAARAFAAGIARPREPLPPAPVADPVAPPISHKDAAAQLRRMNAIKRFEVVFARIRAERAAKLPDCPTMGQIVREVCEKHGLTIAEVRARRKKRELVRARHEIMWRCRKETTFSLPAIAKFLGNFDHTSVMHGISKHERRMKEEAQ